MIEKQFKKVCKQIEIEAYEVCMNKEKLDQVIDEVKQDQDPYGFKDMKNDFGI